MKALVKARPAEGIWMVEDAPEPEGGVHDVMIRIARTAICGTAVHIYNWDAWSQRTLPVPMVIGHEYGGRVERVGA
jgi:threonine 3-dehydrogenase